MFKKKYFYHSHIRKAIIAFGAVFNNIQIRRTNTDDEVTQSLFVPLSYIPKQKFIDRIREVPVVDETRQPFAITLPRIGFEITGISYDPSRKLMVTQPVRSIDVEGYTRTGFRDSFISTPYNMTISLSAYAKNQDDGLQIVEQILPHFNPDFNVTINEIPELGVKRDLQIVLDSISYTDDWEGSFDKRLSIIWDFTFTIKLNFFGFVNDSTLIKRTIQNLYADTELQPGGGPTNTVIGTRITTEVDPFDANPLDPFEYVTQFDKIYGLEE